MHLATLLLCCSALVPSLTGLGAAEAPPVVQKVFQQLEKPIDGDWQKTPLTSVLAALAKSSGIPIQLDPQAGERGTLPVTVHAVGEPLGRVLSRLADRAGLEIKVSGAGTVLLAAVPGTQPAPAWVDDAQPVHEYQPGRSRRLPPPGGWLDPVAALADDDAATLAKPTPAGWSKLLAGHLDRLEAWHIAHSAPAPALVDFLHAHPDIRKEFWRALDPHFDDAKAACRIMEELRADDEKRLIANYQVAIALAVVHDTPNAAISSRYYTLWAVDEKQFGPVLSYRELWDYFTDPKNLERFQFKPRNLAWPMLVHLVDLDVSQAEIDWTWSQYAGKKVDFQACYQSVPYDYGKLNQTATKLGDAPYTLENLRKLGGVCVDQAHFSSRVAKILGIPAMKCGGSGRYGGAGHAWTGYLAAKDGAPQLLFTGRYQFDLYYTGTAFDPQTRTELLDRDVELLYAGVSGGGYNSYADANQLARIAEGLVDKQPDLATVIAKEAVKRNGRAAAAWRVLLRSAPPAELEKLWQQQAKALAAFPDQLCDGLRLVLDRLPDGSDAKEQKVRQGLYEAAYAAAGAAKRPDQQIVVRMAQIDELGRAKQDEVAVTKAFQTVTANIKEGTLIMPLVKTVVTLANRFKDDDPSFKMGLVKDTFAKLEHDFPKARGRELSPAWVEWQELVKSLH